MTDDERKLVEDNIKLIYKYCWDNKLDCDEWFGILSLELCKRVHSYNNKYKFSTFAYTVFKTAVFNTYRNNNTIGRTMPEYLRNIDMDDPNSYGHNSLKDERSYDGFYDLEVADNIRYLFLEIDKHKKPKTAKMLKRVTKMLFYGYSVTDIAKEFNMSRQAIDCHIKTIRKYYKKIMKEGC